MTVALTAAAYAREPRLVFACGRYEGIDARVVADARTRMPVDEVSIGDYVLAGGGFPLTVKGAGVIGVIAVSGLPEREDHGIVVATLCAHLGLDAKALVLSPAEV